MLIEQEETEYLGMIVGKGQIRMDPLKVQGVQDWPQPQKKVDLQSFLGFCNFYQRFIKGYSSIARPLTQLTGNLPWVWEKEQQKAFDDLKRAMITTPVLALPIEDGIYNVEADASKFAIGAVLSQRQEKRW